MALLTKLPMEVLMKICSNLPVSDVKACRASCRTLCAAASPHLFPHVVLGPHYSTIERFRTICKHPVFGPSVKDIIYCDVHFSAEGLARSSDKELLDEDLGDLLDYRSLLYDERFLDDEELELRVVLECLPHLVGLESITISERLFRTQFDEPRTLIRHSNVYTSGYHPDGGVHSIRPFIMFLSALSHFSDGPSTLTSSVSNCFQVYTPLQHRIITLDYSNRTVHGALDDRPALNPSSPGHWWADQETAQGIFGRVLGMNSEFLNLCKNGFRNLRDITLTLTIKGQSDVQGLRSGNLFELLASACHLERLALVQRYQFHNDWRCELLLQDYFGDTGFVWPRLRVLELHGIGTGGNDMLQFLLRHRFTLREIRLKLINLGDREEQATGKMFPKD